MDRITNKMLEIKVDYLNRITGNPETQYVKDESGNYKAQPGNYHISSAYGGVALEQMCNEAGGVHRVSNNGYGTKRELFNFLSAYIAGIEPGK